MLNISRESRILQSIDKKMDDKFKELFPIFNQKFRTGNNLRLSTIVKSGSSNSATNDGLAIYTLFSSEQISLQSNKIIRMIPTLEIISVFGIVFNDPVVGNTQIFGIGDTTFGFFLGYNGSSFGYFHYEDSIKTWLPIEVKGRWKPLEINAYKIIIDDARVLFYVQKSDSSWLLIATHYRKTDIYWTEMFYFKLSAYIISTASTYTALTITFWSAFSDSQINIIKGPLNTALLPAEKALTTNFVPVLSIKNNDTFVSLPNKLGVLLSSINLFNIATSNKIAYIELILNPILTGASWTQIETTAPAYQDTSSTEYSGGYILKSLNIGPLNALDLDIEKEDIILEPGDIVTIVAKSSVSSDINCSINFHILL